MPEDIVTVARFDSLQVAYFARSLLESHGIEAFLTNENATRVMMHPHLSGGVGLQIAEGDLAAAQELLATMDEQDAPRADEPVNQSALMCPQCGGTRSEPAAGGVFPVLSVLLLGLPLLLIRGRRRCGFCGTVFRPSGP